MKTLTEKKARDLAYQWHGGMWSGLYSFASSGKLTNGVEAIKEVNECLRKSDIVVKGSEWGNEFYYKGNNRKELIRLRRYLLIKTFALKHYSHKELDKGLNDESTLNL